MVSSIIYDDDNKVIQQTRAERGPFRHFTDFENAIRDGSRPQADILEGFRSVALTHLANIALRTRRALHFDPIAERIVNDAEAQELLSRKYRAEGHWGIPTGV